MHACCGMVQSLVALPPEQPDSIIFLETVESCINAGSREPAMCCADSCASRFKQTFHTVHTRSHGKLNTRPTPEQTGQRSWTAGQITGQQHTLQHHVILSSVAWDILRTILELLLKNCLSFAENASEKLGTRSRVRSSRSPASQSSAQGTCMETGGWHTERPRCL